MSKKGRSWGRLRSLALVFVVSGGIVLAFYFHMKLAQNNYETYEKAEVCQTRSECRQILDASIIESRTESYSKMKVNGKSASPAGVIFKYFVRVDPVSKGAVRLEIIPTALLHSTSSADGSILTGNLVSAKQSRFAEEVFPVGYPTKIEVWNGKVTILFPVYIGFEKTTENTFTYAISSKKWPAKEDEVSIPTSEHPLVRYEIAKQDFTDSFYVAAAIFLVWWLLTGNGSTRKKTRTK